MARRMHKSQSTPLAQRLARKLRNIGLNLPLPDDQYALHGLNPGRHQKAAGAWSWELLQRCNDGWIGTSIGGHSPATNLARKDSILSYHKANGDINVDAEAARAPLAQEEK